MVIYKEYLTESEREFEALFEEYELGMDKINMLFEMTNSELDFACRQAEIQAVKESTTFDDLQVMYEEAAEQAAEKKEGLWKKFCDFISNLWSKFTGLFKKNADVVKNGEDGNLEIDKAEDETKNFIVRAKDSVVKAVDLAKNFRFIDALKELANPAIGAVAGITAGGVVAGVATGKVIKNRKKYAEELEGVQGALEKVKTVFKTTADMFTGGKKEKDQADEKKEPGVIQKVIRKISDFFKNALAFLRKMWNKLVGVVTGKKSKDDTSSDETQTKVDTSAEDSQFKESLRQLSDEELKNKLIVNKKTLANARKNNDEDQIKKYEKEAKMLKSEIGRRNSEAKKEKKVIDDSIEAGKKRDENAKKNASRNQTLADQQKANQEAGANASSKDAQENTKARLSEKYNSRLKAKYYTGTIEMDLGQTATGTVKIDGKKYSDVKFRKDTSGNVQFLHPVTKSWIDHEFGHGSKPSFKKGKTTVTVLKDKDSGKVSMVDPATKQVVDLPKKVKGINDVKFESVEMIWTEAYEMFGEASIDLAIEFSGGDYTPDYIAESFIDTDDLYGSGECDETVLKECALLIDEL